MSDNGDDKDVDDIVEESLSKKRTVKDILVEMKDTSELMVDLAYSALLTNSKTIAEEVEDLEEKVDNLQYEIETLLMLSARTPEEAADLSGILHVAGAAEDIADAAAHIVDVVMRGVGDHPIYDMFLDETADQVERIVVSEKSKMAGKTIGAVRVLSETGCYIRAIRRGRKWIFDPGKNTKIGPGDVLIVKGALQSIRSLQKLA